MDLPCPRCGEPWELDSLHDVAEERGVSFQAVRADFMAKGCAGLSGDYFGEIAECEPDEKAPMRAVLAELMGDDIDGYMADCEDFAL